MSDGLGLIVWFGVLGACLWGTSRALHVVPNATVRFTLLAAAMVTVAIGLLLLDWLVFGYPSVGD
jgi:hypothetical protein